MPKRRDKTLWDQVITKALVVFIYLLMCFTVSESGVEVFAGAPTGPQLKTATTHPIQYYLSLPEGWTKSKRWPVVIVIESADREFLDAALAFDTARRNRPFILVTPLVVTNGGAGYQSVSTYHYSDEVWNKVRSSGPFTFDMDGISAIMQDIVKDYAGEDKYFITGFEAGGHTVWGIVFNHPVQVRGAALVCPNYLGRWVDEQHISTSPERTILAIRNFVGTKDENCSTGKPIYTQMNQAIDIAEAHGYKNLSLVRIEGKGHERLAGEVMDYFSTIVQP